MKKPEEEWTDKDRIKEQRKQKRREREKLAHINYHKHLAIHRSYQTKGTVRMKIKLREKIHAAER